VILIVLPALLAGGVSPRLRAGRASSRPWDEADIDAVQCVQNSWTICRSQMTMGANLSSALPQRRSLVLRAMLSNRRTRSPLV
jgi:hypothetical protein